MINIPLPFLAIWGIMLAGVLTHALAKVKSITDKTPDNITWRLILYRFINKEWPSYGMSIIITLIAAYSLIFMKRFQKVDNAEISYWVKWMPLAVPGIYLFGVLNQWVFYMILGRIQRKGGVDVDIIKKDGA